MNVIWNSGRVDNFKMWSASLVGFCLVAAASALAFPPQSRIVGGESTTIEARPYQASLQYGILGSYSHTCGASIISKKYLLSAAHCNPGIMVSLMYARVGATSYNSGGQLLKVKSFTPHPDYSRNTLDYDFGIVTLEDESMILGDTVQVIPLSTGKDPEDDSGVIVSGWGVTSESSLLPPTILREVTLPVFNQDKCRDVYSFVTPRQICLGGTPQGSLSACFGDSGGPAVQNGVQYGLVSGGNSCEEPNVPGLYARISAARSWITDVTGV